MVFGLFMAIMDVQIVTSSLTQIQGGLSASTDEIAWVQTAYLIADVVMVPLSGILSRVPLPRVYVTANFKETQLTRMRPGQSAEISVDAYPDQPLRGRVESFAPGSGAQFSLLPPDNATGNFTKIVQRVPVRIAVPADGPLARLLRPGLSVTVTVDTRGDGTAEASDGIIGPAYAGPAASGAPGMR